MVRSRKKKIDKGAEARRLARKVVGAPGTTRVVPDKRKKPAKHKQALLAEEE
jgi:ribosomal protein L44E